jgi:hypothetical protein
MAAMPPGDPRRDVVHPHESAEPAPARDGSNRAGLTTGLTILAALIVVLLIVLL